MFARSEESCNGRVVVLVYEENGSPVWRRSFCMVELCVGKLSLAQTLHGQHRGK